MGPGKHRSWSSRLPADNKLVLFKFHLKRFFICLPWALSCGLQDLRCRLRDLCCYMQTFSWGVWGLFPPGASLGALTVKDPPAVQETQFDPGSGRSPGEGNDYPLQCLRAWRSP